MKEKRIGIMAALSFSYFAVFSFIDPRFADGGLSWHEMFIYEIPIFMVVLLGVSFLWLKGVSGCFRSGETDKAILCFVVWPYAIYLAIKTNKANLIQ